MNSLNPLITSRCDMTHAAAGVYANDSYLKKTETGTYAICVGADSLLCLLPAVSMELQRPLAAIIHSNEGGILIDC